jgi:hypothetical protein
VKGTRGVAEGRTGADAVGAAPAPVRRPPRVSHSYTQRLGATPVEVFPLLCPVREREWVRGWEPTLVLSRSGVAELDCVFTTRSGDGEAVWTVTEYVPPSRIEFVKVVPDEGVTRIAIALEPGGAGTLASVTYTLTGLGPAGDTAVAAFTPERYRQFMETWEAELNHFLAHGEKLAVAPA